MKSELSFILGLFVLLFAPIIDLSGSARSSIIISDFLIFAINAIVGAFGLSLGLSAIQSRKTKKLKRKLAYFGMVFSTVFGLINFYIILRTIFLIFTLKGFL